VKCRRIVSQDCWQLAFVHDKRLEGDHVRCLHAAAISAKSRWLHFKACKPVEINPSVLKLACDITFLLGGTDPDTNLTTDLTK